MMIIFIYLCCSMMSCLICSDLKEINNKITLLDIGSGFDPIFEKKTRPKQPLPKSVLILQRNPFLKIINSKNISCYKFFK